MSTRARKERKASGVKFEREAKVGTPLFKRSTFKQAGRVRQNEMAIARGLKVPVRNTFSFKGKSAA